MWASIGNASLAVRITWRPNVGVADENFNNLLINYQFFSHSSVLDLGLRLQSNLLYFQHLYMVELDFVSKVLYYSTAILKLMSSWRMPTGARVKARSNQPVNRFVWNVDYLKSCFLGPLYCKLYAKSNTSCEIKRQPFFVFVTN